MKKRNLGIFLGILLTVGTGALWLKTRSTGGLHPFISPAEVEEIATMLITSEFSGSGGRRPRRVTADILGNPPSTKLTDMLDHVVARPPYLDVEVHWSMKELVSFSPLSSRATVRTGAFVKTIGQKFGGGAEGICILLRRNGQWELEHRRDLAAW